MAKSIISEGKTTNEAIEKGLKEMTEIELAIYILKNGIDDEVNALTNSKVVKIMKKKLRMFNEDEHLRDMYYKRGANEF